MKKSFNSDDLETAEQGMINSLILEQASDIAEKLTDLECKLNGIECIIEEEDESRYTEEAQDIFNVYYDQACDELYNLLNAQLKAIK